MITLPLVVTSGTKATASSHTASASTSSSAEVGTETTAAAGEDAAAGEGSSKGFLTLLGNKLLTLAQQSEKGQAATAAATNAAAGETAEAGQSSKAKLNALLAALDKPETLNALLQPEKIGKELKVDEKATDENQAAAPALNDSDRQTLQALFAMLPPVAPQQPATQVKGSESLADGQSIKGAKQSTLASLLSTGNAEESDKGKTSGKADTAVTASTGGSSQKSTLDTSALTTAFQQALGHAGKETDKENSSSAPASTITNNVISAASSLTTPVTTSLVTAPASAQLSSQLGSQEWQQALGQQILMFSKNGQQTAELHLHPQDLGSIQISLKLDNDQAQLNMVSGHSQVRAALEAAIPQLRTALAENGISLGQSNVSSDAFQQGQSFSGQQEQQRNNSSGNKFNLAAENDSEVTAIAVPASLQARAAGSNAVDIFA